METIDKIGADRLAYACARQIIAGRINSRSGIADALLDYLRVGQTRGPSSVPEWMREYEAGRAMPVPDEKQDCKRTLYHSMCKKEETPKVGVGVVLTKKIDDIPHILMGLRKGSHPSGEWGLPGGHMKVGEGFWGACSRELREETGLHITSIDKMLGFSNDDLIEDGLHYVTLYFQAGFQPGESNSWEPQVMEPDKCEEWRWWPLSDLPENIWTGIKRYDILDQVEVYSGARTRETDGGIRDMKETLGLWDEFVAKAPMGDSIASECCELIGLFRSKLKVEESIRRLRQS